MNKVHAYIQLLRLDKPIGILLLWFPTAWALWIAHQGVPTLKLVLLFFAGTVLMRSAGCVINDIADRNIDCHVTRTHKRPITSGVISLHEALLLLVVVLWCALFVLIQLPYSCYYWAVFSLLVTCIYPLCKRYIQAPQMVLGIAFSMGIPMAYAASSMPLDSNAVFLILMNSIWIIAYDTMYAMTDKADDLKIGVKSTAIYFGSKDVLIIGILLSIVHGLWLYWAIAQGLRIGFYLFWLFGLMVLIYQQNLVKSRNPKACFQAFLVSALYGALMWGAVIFSMP